MIRDDPKLRARLAERPWDLTPVELHAAREVCWLEEQEWAQSMADVPPRDGPPLDTLDDLPFDDPPFEPSEQDRQDLLMMELQNAIRT